MLTLYTCYCLLPSNFVPYHTVLVKMSAVVRGPLKNAVARLYSQVVLDVLTYASSDTTSEEGSQERRHLSSTPSKGLDKLDNVNTSNQQIS
jgi:hypothetical protein